MLGHPADGGVLEVDDHRMARRQLGVDFVEAGGKVSRKAGVAGRRPNGASRPHPGAGTGGAVQDGAGIPQSVEAALAGGLVADGENLVCIKGEKLDAGEILKPGGRGPGQGSQQQGQHKEQGGQAAAERGGGLHGKSLLSGLFLG